MARRRNTEATRTANAQAAQVARIRRGMIVVVVVAALAGLGLWRYLYSPQELARDAAQAELDTIQMLVDRERQDLEAVRAGNPDSLRALHERVSALDRTIPSDIDGLELAVWLESSVPAGLGGLAVPDPGRPRPVSGIEEMHQVTIPVTATGPRATLLAWINTLQTTPTRLVTIEAATLTHSSDGASTLSVTLVVWHTPRSLLVPPQVQPGLPPGIGGPPDDGQPDDGTGDNGQPDDGTGDNGQPDDGTGADGQPAEGQDGGGADTGGSPDDADDGFDDGTGDGFPDPFND